MKKALIDTNIYTHALMGVAETIAVLQQAELLGVEWATA